MTTSLEMTSAQDDEEKKSLSNKDVNKDEERGQDRSTYLDSFKLFVRILPAILDHLSDLPVLATLYAEGYTRLFWVGVAIDLLPGPVTAYQFFLLGFRREWIFLLLHPLNVFVYTFLALCKLSDRVTNFSRRVVAYCHESQALLESPMQIVFTTSLICHGILPLPWDKGTTFSNSFGNEINLSWFPLVSIVFSLASIVFNAGGTVNLLENLLSSNFKRTSTWLLFLLSSVLFRLEAWTLLATYLAEFVVIIVIVTFAINLITLIFTQGIIKLDPLITATYSLIFPITFMKSVYEATVIEEEIRLVKQIHRLLALSGTTILGLALWILYFCMPYLAYNPEMVISRDRFFYFLVASSLMGIVSMISTVFISAPKWEGGKVIFRRLTSFGQGTIEIIKKRFPFNLKPNEQIVIKNIVVLKPFGIVARLFLLFVVIGLFVWPFFMAKIQVSYEFGVRICGNEVVNETFHTDIYGTASFDNGSLLACSNEKEHVLDDLRNNFDAIGCLQSRTNPNATMWILLDKAPSTQIPSSVWNGKGVILVSKDNEQRAAIERLAIQAKRCERDPPLVIAAREGDLKKVKRLIAKGEDVNKASLRGELPITEAANGEHLDILTLLIDEGAKPNATTSTGWTALHFAALKNNREIGTN